MNAQSEDAFATTAEFIALYYRPMDPHRAIRSICTMMVSGGSLGSGWLAGCGRRT
jgi:hypothetical protein